MPSTERKPWVLPYRVAADITPEETQFLWNPYIPFGAMTLLAGKGGVGKSTVICDIAARLSAGRPLPMQNRTYKPMKVLIVSAEDDLSHKIVPRLLGFDADMKNIALSDETFTIDDPHIGGIENAMAAFEATVVFLDPIVAYLGGQMDINKSNETRAFMNKLGKIARGKQKAVIVAAHSRKNVGKHPSIDDVMGSADFVNAARSGILIFERDGQKVFKHDKANWSELGPTLAFTLQNGVSWSEWIDRGQHNPISTVPRKADQARDFLFETLLAGPLPAKEVLSRGKLLGLSEATLLRVKNGTVRSIKAGNEWIWSLLEANDPNPEATYLENKAKQEEDDRIAGIVAQARAKMKDKAGG
jgi:DNA repair protein RadA/Sms